MRVENRLPCFAWQKDNGADLRRIILRRCVEEMKETEKKIGMRHDEEFSSSRTNFKRELDEEGTIERGRNATLLNRSNTIL